jgi:hypothetical protein
VFAWSGGQTADRLSKQIDGYFVEHDPTLAYTGVQGRMTYWQPYLVVPNDFIMDMEGQSWWKLEDSSDTGREIYSHYDTSALNNKLYAFPYRNAPAADPVVYSYDPDVLRSSYSWKSLPIIETRRNLIAFEDVEITFTMAYPWTVATTIAVTLTGINELGQQVQSNTMTFTANVTSPAAGSQVTIKQNVSASAGVQGAFTAKYVQVRVVATAASGPAPKIHEILLGVREDKRQAVA